MDKITVENFRCFREKQTARLAPLTLLVGENSTGKTSFLALIRALWDTAFHEKDPNFKEDPYDLGSFDEIAHHRGGPIGRADAFQAGFEYKLQSELRKLIGSEPFRFEATFERKDTVPVPERRRLSNKDVWLEFHPSHREIRFGTRRGSWKCHLSAEALGFLDWRPYAEPLSLFFKLWHSIGQAEYAHPWKTVSGSPEPSKADLDSLEDVVHLSRAELSTSQKLGLYASAPVRSKPRRTYDPARPTQDPEGEYIPMYLSSLHFRSHKQWAALKGALETFGNAAGLFSEISVRPFGKKGTEPFQVQIRRSGKRAKGPQRNLIDVGYGVSQVLPVITELLRADAPLMYLLQQPEVHLHPSAQAALGSLFCQIAGPQRQLVVETHSDHLLSRVRMDVRDGEGNLKPEDLSILFFERRDLEVRIHSLEIDGEGNVLNAPSVYRQFFVDEMERSIWKKRSLNGK